MTEARKPWRPSVWMVLGALLLVAACLRALAGANRYGNASDQFRLELVLSTIVALIVSGLAISAVIYIGERPGHLRAQTVAQLSDPRQDVWAARVDSRSRSVIAAMSRADGGRLAKPGLYFVVTFDSSGLTIVTSTKKSSLSYFVPIGRIRGVRTLDYRLPHGKSESIAVTFERDGQRFDLPLVLVTWKSISHHPVGVDFNAEMIERLRSLWQVSADLAG